VTVVPSRPAAVTALAGVALTVLGLVGCTSAGGSAVSGGSAASGGTASRSAVAPSRSAPPSRSAAPAGTEPGAPDDGTVTLMFTGDMLVSDELRAQAARYARGHGFDFAPMLRTVAPIIRSADWAVCHQETAISPDNRLLAGWPSFSAPYQLAAAEKAAGYDSCTTASNHTFDHSAAGVRGTLDTFDRFGIQHVGSARTAAESHRLTIYTVRGVRIGHLAYTYGLNGDVRPAGWAVNLIDPARIRADARRIRTAGAQFVIVSLHFGTEQEQRPSAFQRQIVAQLMASPDVDLVIGHHAHVVQPIQRWRNGRWVIFGLGNFLAQQSVRPPALTPPHRDGVIVRVTIAPGPRGRYAVRQVGYIPTYVNAPLDVIQFAPPFSRARTVAALTAFGAPLVDDTPR
jgi:poly-gamma-glutamate capsule biosynthesis protein CapA/YwtB (metallophosphatase superfamily)